jgi:hypothetical protein
MLIGMKDLNTWIPGNINRQGAGLPDPENNVASGS